MGGRGRAHVQEPPERGARAEEILGQQARDEFGPHDVLRGPSEMLR